MDPTRTGEPPPRYKSRVMIEQGGPGGPRHVCTDPPLLPTREALVDFVRGMGGPDLSADVASVVDVEAYVGGVWRAVRRLQGPPPPTPAVAPGFARDPNPPQGGSGTATHRSIPAPDRIPPQVDVALAVLDKIAQDAAPDARAVRAAALAVLLTYLS